MQAVWRAAIGLCVGSMALAAVLFAAGPAAKPRSGQPVQLFNGKDLSNWTYALRNSDLKMEDVWSVQDGQIVCLGKPSGYIRTKDKFTNYKLVVEWRWAPGKKPGNSGVLLRMVGEDKVWPKSIEAQLGTENAGDFWNIDMFQMTVDQSRTEGRRTKKLHPSNEKPIGEWNRYDITCDGGHVSLVVNGLLQNEATDCAEVAGFVCLQSEGAEIHFRKVELTPLD